MHQTSEMSLPKKATAAGSGYLPHTAEEVKDLWWDAWIRFFKI